MTTGDPAQRGYPCGCPINPGEQPTMNTPDTPRSVLDFWYSPALREHWFGGSPHIDTEITERFETLWQDARDDKLDAWAETADGALALVIILDQFQKSDSTLAYALDYTIHYRHCHYRLVSLS